MITASLLHDVANYVEARIAKVVLNGSFELSDFEQKAVTEGVLALNYIVPAEHVEQISKIELKDDQDHVITTVDVNVPIASDTLMLQTIEVKEVTK